MVYDLKTGYQATVINATEQGAASFNQVMVDPGTRYYFIIMVV